MLAAAKECAVRICCLHAGSYLNLVATGVPQARLTKVFLSHLHSDHIADLASLVSWCDHLSAGDCDHVRPLFWHVRWYDMAFWAWRSGTPHTAPLAYTVQH